MTVSILLNRSAANAPSSTTAFGALSLTSRDGVNALFAGDAGNNTRLIASDAYFPTVPNPNRYTSVGAYTTAQQIGTSGTVGFWGSASTIPLGSYVALEIFQSSSTTQCNVGWLLANGGSSFTAVTDPRLLNLAGNRYIVSPFPVVDFRVSGVSAIGGVAVKYKLISNYNGSAPAIAVTSVPANSTLYNVTVTPNTRMAVMVILENLAPPGTVRLFTGLDATSTSTSLAPMPDVAGNASVRPISSFVATNPSAFIGYTSAPIGSLRITTTTAVRVYTYPITNYI